MPEDPHYNNILVFGICIFLIYKTFVYKHTDTIEFMGVRTIAPEENCPPLRLRAWVKVRVRIRVGGNFPREQLSQNRIYEKLTSFSEKYNLTTK